MAVIGHRYSETTFGTNKSEDNLQYVVVYCLKVGACDCYDLNDKTVRTDLNEI